MTEFTIASFNLKNLIGADEEYYQYESYTPEEYAWKKNWISNQLLTMNADIIGFQEIFDTLSIQDVINDVNQSAVNLNAGVVPDSAKRYYRKAIFQKLHFKPYESNQLFVANNINDGEPGQRRPGIAMLSRYGFVQTPEVIQELTVPLVIDFPTFDEQDESITGFRLKRLSRPIIKAKIDVNGQIITVFNCHLKSKLGEYIKAPHEQFALETALTHYLPAARAMGQIRAMIRRSAEAQVLRQLIIAAIDAGEKVMVLGDLNDSEYSITSAVLKGEQPFKNYAWMRRHDAKHKSDRYTEQEDLSIRAQIMRYQLESAEMQFIKSSQRDMVYTTAFNGVYESIDQILMSQHFLPNINPNAIGQMDYFSVFNDHITNGAHPEAPYNKLASDHGQIMAHMRLFND